jgi:hypothetical protein
MRRRLIVLSILLVALAANVDLIRAQGGLELPWFRVAIGGATGLVSGSYELGGTFGQAEAGTIASGSYTLQGGFWGVADVTRTPTATATATATAQPSSTRTATATSSPTRTPTVLPSVTGTATPSPTSTATPYPQANVGVQVAPGSTAGSLQATIRARDAGCANNTQNNQLLSFRFTRLSNATVDVPGLGTISAASATPLALTGQPASITLTMRRVRSGEAATAELVVTDGCGEWPTFIGGGPSSF